MIDFKCVSCGAGFSVPDAHAGKRGKCPKCQRVMTVPAKTSSPDDPPPPVPTLAPSPATALESAPSGGSEEPGPSRCPKCGLAWPYDGKHCRYCGDGREAHAQVRSWQPAVPVGDGDSAREPADNAPTVRTDIVVFRPLRSITWPNHCVGCSAENPPAKIKLNVFPATRTSTGTKVGGVGGAFVGALVGGIAGGIASVASGETSEYQLPICDRCLGNLPPADLKALANVEFRMITMSPRIYTRLMTREFKSWRVVLTFANMDYARRFRSANRGLVFDSVEASKAPRPAGAAQAQKTTAEAAQAAEPAAETRRADDPPFERGAPPVVASANPIPAEAPAAQAPPTPEEEDKAAAQSGKTQACPGCGRQVATNEFACPYCGRTDWGSVTVGLVLGIGLVMMAILWGPTIESGFWRFLVKWVGGIAGVLFLLVTLCELIKGARAKRKVRAQPSEAPQAPLADAGQGDQDEVGAGN